MKKILITLLLGLFLVGCEKTGNTEDVETTNAMISYTQEDIDNALPSSYTIEIFVTATTEAYGAYIDDSQYVRYVKTPAGFGLDYSDDGVFSDQLSEVSYCSGTTCERYQTVRDYGGGADAYFWMYSGSTEMQEYGNITCSQFNTVAIVLYAIVNYEMEPGGVPSDTYGGREAIECEVDWLNNENFSSYQLYIDAETHMTLYQSVEMDIAVVYSLQTYEVIDFMSSGTLPSQASLESVKIN